MRAFAIGKRAERVFEPVTLFWRYLGDVRLIGGPDLASSIVQPHTFLDYASGRLRSLFIDSIETLESRMPDLEGQPDPDGRFRINDFFCYDDMWRTGVARLVGRSHVILADFRRFTIKSHGCEYEIREVLNTTPVERFVILVDSTTDVTHLAGILEDSWSNLKPASPNVGRLNHAIQTVFYEMKRLSAVRFRQCLTRSLLPPARPAVRTQNRTKPDDPSGIGLNRIRNSVQTPVRRKANWRRVVKRS